MLSLLLLLQLVAPSQPVPRIDRLADWLASVAQHTPGTADDAAVRVRSWDASELERVYRDLQFIFALVRDPRAPLPLYVIDPRRTNRRPEPGYSSREVNALRALAAKIAFPGFDPNRILKRGAMLHTDIAMLVPPQGSPADGSSTGTFARTTLHFDDGRPIGMDDAAGHWDVARALMDRVTGNPERDERPNPASDETVRQWYRATTAFMQWNEKLDVRHFRRAVELFPADPEILFMAGSLHETLAGPRVQETLRTANIPNGVSFGVGSERGELRAAEDLFRRAVTVDPQLVEARIRLGRVLGLLGRPADAVKELRLAASSAREPLLVYFAELFLGREAAALGDVGQARTAYVRAAAVYPAAQSPSLGLSQIASQYGDRATAVSSIQGVLSLPLDADERDDPWWSYLPLAGRGADARLTELYDMIPVEVSR